MEKEADIIKSLSPRMRVALAQLAASKQPCTCTSIGSLLTRRQSAYGWQTSAREGGRTLMALGRRKLAQAQAYDPAQKIWPWMITNLGSKIARTLANASPASASLPPPVIDQACPHCGEALDEEDREVNARHGPMTCPRCGRAGCDGCMPFGLGVKCPECEELREAIPDLW
jgi:hypothetical protein